MLEERLAALRRLGRGAGRTIGRGPHRPGGPPLWIGGSAPQAVLRAGRLGDGWVAAVMRPEEIRDRVALLDEAGCRVPLAALVSVFVWDGPEQPWDLVRDLQWYVRWKYEDLAARPEPSTAAPSPPPLGPATERRLRARAIVGRPADVPSGLAELADIVGPSGQVVARAYCPGCRGRSSAARSNCSGRSRPRSGTGDLRRGGKGPAQAQPGGARSVSCTSDLPSFCPVNSRRYASRTFSRPLVTSKGTVSRPSAYQGAVFRLISGPRT